MTITRYQLPKKIMILCAWGEKRMNLSISGLRQSSFFTSQVEWLVNGRSNALVLAWKYQDLTQLNGDSAASSECLLVLRKAIVRAVELEGFSGVLVLHDADTLAYSAAAMSFLLSGLPAAIVFTGGLLPVDADESDVWENITGALMLLIEGVADGVYLYFHGEMLMPLRSTKIKTSGRHPFVEHDVVACQRDISYLPDHISYRTPMESARVGVVPLYPGLDSSFLDGMLVSGVQALVLEHEGSEWVIDEGSGLVESLRNASLKGIVVVAISRCAGRSPHRVGDNIRDAGVVSAGYITREAVLGKLYVLLGVRLKPNQIREFIEH